MAKSIANRGVYNSVGGISRKEAAWPLFTLRLVRGRGQKDRPAVWDKPTHYIFNKLAALSGMRHGELPGLRGEFVSDTEIKTLPFSCAGAYGLADKIRKNLLSSGYWEYGRGSSGY